MFAVIQKVWPLGSRERPEKTTCILKKYDNAFYAAAIAAGATDNGKPGARLYYDPRYYAANVFEPDGYSIEVVYKSWQHRQP